MKTISVSTQYQISPVAEGISLLKYNGGKLHIDTSLPAGYTYSYRDGVWREGSLSDKIELKGEFMIVFPCSPEMGKILPFDKLLDIELYHTGLNRLERWWFSMTGKEPLTAEISCGNYFPGYYDSEQIEEFFNQFSPALHIKVNRILKFNRVAAVIGRKYGAKNLLVKGKRRKGWTFVYRLRVLTDAR